MDFREEIMNKDIQQIIGPHEYDEMHIERYPLSIACQILKIYLEWACQPQNYAGIELGRNKIRKIKRSWLNEHFLEAAQEAVDFSDEWEFRRLMEVVVDVVPKLKEDILKLVADSKNIEIMEIVEEYKDL